MTLVHTIGGIPNYPLIFPNHPLPLAPPSLRRPIKIWPNFKCQSFCATKKATFPKHGKYVGLSPCPVTVTTRIVVFLVGDPNLNLYLPLLLGGGTIQQICYHGDGRFIVLSIDLLQRGEEGRHQRLRVILLRVRNPVEILLLTNWDLTHKIISQQNIYTVHTYHQLLSVHSLFPSVPHMTYFQIGGPCWRICTSYTPNTTRDWLLTTTKGYLAHWMRERIQWDALRFFWCLKNMQGDASKCFHMTYQKYCFSATVCLSFFSAFTALASLIVCHQSWNLRCPQQLIYSLPKDTLYKHSDGHCCIGVSVFWSQNDHNISWKSSQNVTYLWVPGSSLSQMIQIWKNNHIQYILFVWTATLQIDMHLSMTPNIPWQLFSTQVPGAQRHMKNPSLLQP